MYILSLITQKRDFKNKILKKKSFDNLLSYYQHKVVKIFNLQQFYKSYEVSIPFLSIALNEAAAFTTEYHDFQKIPDPDELMKITTTYLYMR